MANKVQGNVLVCINSTATENTIKVFRQLAIEALKAHFADEENGASVIADLTKTVKVIKVKPMTEDGYPTSPFPLVIDHNKAIPFSLKDNLPALRWDVNLNKLGLPVPKYEGNDRFAYSYGQLVSCFKADAKGISRLSQLGNVVDKLVEWKKETRATLEREGYDPKDVTKYDATKITGLGATPYCITLPEEDSCIISLVVAVKSEKGNTYYKQLFGWHYNVGLTHTGAVHASPESVIGADKVNALLGQLGKQTETDDVNALF